MAEENEKKLEAVAKGKVSSEPRMSPGALFKDFIIGDIRSVAKSMIVDYFMPQAKQNIYNALKGGLDMLFWGPGGVRKNSSNGLGTKVNYGGFSSGSTVKQQSAVPSARTSGTMDPEDVHFETRIDAQDVLDTLNEALERYNQVSLSDFLEISGVPNDNFQFRKYGWTDLTGAEPRRMGNGEYYLKLPKIKPIN